MVILNYFIMNSGGFNISFDFIFSTNIITRIDAFYPSTAIWYDIRYIS